LYPHWRNNSNKSLSYTVIRSANVLKPYLHLPPSQKQPKQGLSRAENSGGGHRPCSNDVPCVGYEIRWIGGGAGRLSTELSSESFPLVTFFFQRCGIMDNGWVI